ncbi:MAG: 3-deoxy-7-phosphoheptulonate synthase [Myxococcales bacterium]|nr:3-deoxy-7-phosphoheptulonate synthase [Myxococcales bacterium]
MVLEEVEQIEDRNLIDIRPLTSPRALKHKLPISDTAARTVVQARSAIRDVIHGRDMRRLVVIAGPCSIHDPEAAVEYARNLHRAAGPLENELVVVMRTYFEKPRTTVGWKGLVNDPHLDGRCDVWEGLETVRRLLLEINELGVACATEVLDPFTPQFLADLLAWASIGARTAESQTHRQLASGLSMPIGFKNGTNGAIEVAHNAMVAAGHSHTFLGISADGHNAAVQTNGNPDRHVVLRGGGGRTNYDSASIEAAAELVRGEGIVRPVMVDCSHDNSGKDHTRQGPACLVVLKELRAHGGASLMGLLLESNLKPGSQKWTPGAELERGVSITDACMGWEETEDLLNQVAEAVKVSS